ncbi:ABC transporter substrate-binding protein [Saccharopolyspora sp. HNM0983]|uniref:ABC transporter substrate-binding protein n=1 Tax=Saccharopolyspora montiporae TaxID=2781240 RepID=A0A929FZA9_9PSEU|nr:helical backbone metal receptor [Saccharopolyspora sp. HNM0983]MBE9374199.1 ABC transporter substrate-binding protein [Saccharopolyspora sp. HNM0983]
MNGLRRLHVLLLATLVLLVGSACATRPEPQTQEPVDDPASSFPVKVELPGQEPVTLTQQPKRIVSLSPSATESLYAIGAGEQVTAVDSESNHPQEAPRTDLSGLEADAAAVGAHDPDLVIAPDSATELAEGLRSVDVPVLLTPTAERLDDAYAQIEALGKATGHAGQAQHVVNGMRAEIAEIVRGTPKAPEPLSYYHEVSPDHYTTTSRSFLGDIYAKFGLRNIADEAEGDFPQLSEEQIVRADPALVFLADGKCCQVTPESAAQRPGWSTITAVRDGNVVPLDDDLAGRWGPRVVDLVRDIGEGVAGAQRR